jgi:[pyruvate, water dikinase]-phosphate phosphotransferase / [pyruvate, water dikinase] kinase
VNQLHLHLVSDSTGETLESMAKAGLSQFEGVEAVKHFWPMVRSEGHLDRVLDEVALRPGLILYTLVGGAVRARLEQRAASMGLPVVAVLDPVVEGLSRVLGLPAKARPGRQHVMDAAYFRRVEAITYTMAHDDGLAPENWEAADIVLAGVSRSSKTPTSIYLANRGYKCANMPLVPGAPLPDALAVLQAPLVVGLTVSADRLVQVRRNRLLAIGAATDDRYVDPQSVAAEVMAARRLFADRGWPVIDVTRRSIEETAAGIINLLNARAEQQGGQTA